MKTSLYAADLSRLKVGDKVYTKRGNKRYRYKKYVVVDVDADFSYGKAIKTMPKSKKDTKPRYITSASSRYFYTKKRGFKDA